MVKIRLMRVGKRKQPSYRVVVADSRSPRDGRIIEAIGRYNPRSEPSIVEINGDRAVHWLERGAQPSEAVRKLLQISGAWYTFTGERPPAGGVAAPSAAPKPTPAESIKATPAASVEEPSDEEVASDAATAEVAVPDESGADDAGADESGGEAGPAGTAREAEAAAVDETAGDDDGSSADEPK